MPTHHLDSTITQPWWDRHARPRLTVDSGDTVVCECPEPCGQVTPEWKSPDLAERWDTSKVHALLGPIDVRGATAGGSIDVEILDIQHHAWAWSGLLPGFGLLADEFPEPYLHHWKLDDRGCVFGVNDIIVPFRPMVGCVGVAPKTDERLDTLPPRDNGGNLDIRHLTVGATLTLPVFREGAGVGIGDGHAAQGDGEVCGTGVEAPLRITARLTARPDIPAGPMRLSLPAQTAARLADASREIFIATGPDAHECIRDAVRQAVDHLAAAHHLRREQAMVLASAVCDVRMSQAVNAGNYTVTAHLPDVIRS